MYIYILYIYIYIEQLWGFFLTIISLYNIYHVLYDYYYVGGCRASGYV